ncbi:(E3-independent) E2 ubiquitin-conjugating enzyme UBE2O isoform X1 [Salmo salar]|uniref:(E3-independent) E2 ubiquitin-conjugating enzyme n=1 Tax=Salmo salar TaxID=8030 RepID=A0A1S3L7E8_SALSA|nr:(E3-independent) E2 ubiquitin-conjugating enzyme UBE2O-like isoform X1 [Salmo salar]|eukprot:XP_013986892.1 PREDICTED: E2/E3 hybrid ubiquitin-protein ligase UBE2O-like isoform X1 [Salmo salar]
MVTGFSFFFSTIRLPLSHYSLTTAAMAEPVASDAALSPAVSPGSEPPSMALSPSAGGSQRLLFSHDLVSGRYRDLVRFGLVRMIQGEEEFDSDSDLDDGGGRGGGGGGCIPCNSDTESSVVDSLAPLGRGFVRVQWYPEGGKQDIRETKLKLVDRSIVIRDIVRRMNSNDNQCGIVTNIDIECAVKLVGTNCVLYPVNSKDLHHIWSFMYGDYIAYDFWLGKVYNLTNHIILKLSNGARCSMNVEDGAKLYDVCPHVSDSGLFFEEAYGFYPGQVLIGPAKVFSNVQWLSGVKPVLRKKIKFRVVVEEVQVAELKVTWITKSYSPKGTDSVYPPPSTISQENLCRVKRLGYYDHTQRQLGERALYVFPANGDTTHITCEWPDGAPGLPEDPVARKLKRMFKKELLGKKTSENADTQGANQHSTDNTDSLDGDLKPDNTHPDSTDHTALPRPHHPNNGPNHTLQPSPLCPPPSDPWPEPAEQDADDEAGAEDTDDTLSLTSSASSTASSQSGGLGGLNRKKSIPLSIRNLKRKHKKKRTKFSREFKPGDRVAVEVVSTKTSADVLWKDGRMETLIRSNDLIPIQHLDNHEFCPGDFVVDKRPQAPTDPGVYGVIQSGDHKGRTCAVKWIKLNASSDNVEVIGEEEDVSVYDIADHPDFHFRTTDIVIRIGNSENERNTECENDTSVGQVFRVDVSSKVEVVWADNSMTIVLPQVLMHLYNVESEIEETDYDSVEESSSGLSTEEWEDESDSWETDNGLTTNEDDQHPANEDTATPAPTGPSPFIIPPEEGGKAGATTATKPPNATEDLEGAGAIASPGAGAGGTTPGAGGGDAAEKLPGKEGTPRGFRELKEALKILESLKNMTVEQLWTGGSPTSPTSGAAPSANGTNTNATTAITPEKPTKEKRFLDDIKKLQENLRKTLDNVAIVEEERMEAVVEAGGGGAGGGGSTEGGERGGEERLQEEVAKTPGPAPEWPSDTPVLCQQSGGKPGVTFTSAKGEVFSVLEWSPDTHTFKKMEFQPAEAKKFFSTVRKEMALLATSLPDGIMVKTFEDRMDLFSALIKGPTRTPYEDGLFLFDIQLPNIYPSVPPLFRYLSQCSGRLNPNLYDNGKVCVSLLGTWIGKGTERWTSKSSLLQVLISIQGLILVNEPYYNEAGFDSDRGLQEGYENSRCYNEMALIKMVQSMTQLLQTPIEVFQQEIRQHFTSSGWRLVHRLDAWLELHELAERGPPPRPSRDRPPSVEPLDETLPLDLIAHSTPNKHQGTGDEELEDSGLSLSTTATSQQELSRNLDGAVSATEVAGASVVVSGSVRGASSDSGGGSQPAVRPKKRRKSYRSFLPERSGYPDIGFPLFPLSKGFVKSVRCVLLQYRAALAANSIPDHVEDNVQSPDRGQM